MQNCQCSVQTVSPQPRAKITLLRAAAPNEDVEDEEEQVSGRVRDPVSINSSGSGRTLGSLWAKAASCADSALCGVCRLASPLVPHACPFALHRNGDPLEELSKVS
jgi:hypothetical protein